MASALVSVKHPPVQRRTKNERFQKSLQKHQEEMERLIKNISARIQGSVAAEAKKLKLTPLNRPFNYSNDPVFDIDIGLKSHSGHDAKWQPVEGTRHKFYVYSAYYDKRSGKRLIRVIAATKTKHADKVSCR